LAAPPSSPSSEGPHGRLASLVSFCQPDRRDCLWWRAAYRLALPADACAMEDIGFLLRQEPVSPRELQGAFARARVPDVAEIRELFIAAQPKVLRLAGDITQ